MSKLRAVLLITIISSLLVGNNATAQAQTHYFSETGYSVSGPAIVRL